MVDPVLFDVGPVSEAAALLLAGGTASYALFTGVYAWRGHMSRLQDRWSATAAAAVMAALAFILWRDGARILPAPFSTFLVVVFVGAIVFTLTYTLGRYRERIDRFRQQAGARLASLLQEILPEERYAEWERLQERFVLGLEERRKAPHLMMGLFLLGYAFLGHLLLQAIWGAGYGGVPSAQAGEGIQNLYQASHTSWLAAGHLASMTILLTILFTLAPTELLRLRFPELSYPFKAIIVPRLREREKGLFGAHYYIVAAAPVAALWLTRDPSTWDVGIPAVMAVLAVTVFADTASALVGVRWGRRKWFHYRTKSYLGTVGGSLVALAVALPFVGLPMAIVSALVFAFLDAIAPVPVPVSDNLLNPIGLAVAYSIGWAYLHPLVPFY